MKIAFVWHQSSDKRVFDHWNDGLRQAMRIIEKQHEVVYHEPYDNIEADLILYWEAPCTINGQHLDHWKNIQNSSIKKALLFAGGPIIPEALDGFDMIFTESQINDDEFEMLGLPYKRAFGINDTIFKPLDLPKVYDGFHQATCANWKRQGLLCRALKEKAAVAGRDQANDPLQFQICRSEGSAVYNEQPYEEVNKLINSSWAVVNTSEFWGGGQRATLEAMATGTPVIVMNDSPKNMEYVQESGAGIIVEPNEEAIRNAIKEIKEWTPEQRSRGIDYIKNKWTAQHYADSLLTWINNV